MNIDSQHKYTSYLNSVAQEFRVIAVNTKPQIPHTPYKPKPMKKEKEGSDMLYLSLEPKAPCLYGIGAGEHAKFRQDNYRHFSVHIGLFYPVNQKIAGHGKNFERAVEILRCVEQKRSDFFVVKPGDILPNGYEWKYLNMFKR